MTDQPLPLTQALGFTRQPFDKNIPTKQLFVSRQIQQLFSQLQQLLQRRGIALVTGEIGAGKSTAIRAFIDQLEPSRFDIAYIADPTIGIRGMLNSIAIQLHLEGGYFKWQLLEKLKHTIEKNAYDFNKTIRQLADSSSMKSSIWIAKRWNSSAYLLTSKSIRKLRSTWCCWDSLMSTKPSASNPCRRYRNEPPSVITCRDWTKPKRNPISPITSPSPAEPMCCFPTR